MSSNNNNNIFLNQNHRSSGERFTLPSLVHTNNNNNAATNPRTPNNKNNKNNASNHYSRLDDHDEESGLIPFNNNNTTSPMQNITSSSNNNHHHSNNNNNNNNPLGNVWNQRESTRTLPPNVLEEMNNMGPLASPSGVTRMGTTPTLSPATAMNNSIRHPLTLGENPPLSKAQLDLLQLQLLQPGAIDQNNNSMTRAKKNKGSQSGSTMNNTSPTNSDNDNEHNVVNNSNTNTKNSATNNVPSFARSTGEGDAMLDNQDHHQQNDNNINNNNISRNTVSTSTSVPTTKNTFNSGGTAVGTAQFNSSGHSHDTFHSNNHNQKSFKGHHDDADHNENLLVHDNITTHKHSSLRFDDVNKGSIVGVVHIDSSDSSNNTKSKESDKPPRASSPLLQPRQSDPNNNANNNNKTNKMNTPAKKERSDEDRADLMSIDSKGHPHNHHVKFTTEEHDTGYHNNAKQHISSPTTILAPETTSFSNNNNNNHHQNPFVGSPVAANTVSSFRKQIASARNNNNINDASGDIRRLSKNFGSMTESQLMGNFLETGTAESSSFAGGDEGGNGADANDPLVIAIVDNLHRSDLRRRREATGSQSSPNSCIEKSLSFTHKHGSANDVTADQSLEPSQSPTPTQAAVRQHAALLHAAVRERDLLFTQLDRKSSRACVIADPQASLILWVNEAAQRLFGRLDLVGSNLESLMPQEIAVRHAGLVESYRERYEQEYKRSFDAPDSRFLDRIKPRRLTVVRKNGGKDEFCRIDAWARSMRLPEESLEQMPRLVILEAYEAQKYHEDAETSRTFKAALGHVSDGIVIADFQGIIEYMNDAAELLCGYSLASMLGLRASVNMLVPSDQVNQHEGYLQHFRNSHRMAAANLETAGCGVVVPTRRVIMRTAWGPQEILLRIEVAYDKLIAYMKSTREYIPREDFANERLKLLLPAAIVKLLQGSHSSSVSDISSFFWEFENKTVMFTDVVQFLEWANNRPIKAVHDRLQPMFTEFEAIIDSFGGELIHRIGDAMLIIFGFNGEERHHARYALACAVELQQWSINNGFLVRIGLHSGSIGAGIYGSDKGRPSFDTWGPVVNIAKRLETHCEPGNVHFSKHVRGALGSRFAQQFTSSLREKTLSNIKGIQDGEVSYTLPVKHDSENRVILADKFLQLVAFQKARFTRWRIGNEETERRLEELQKASRM